MQSAPGHHVQPEHGQVRRRLRAVGPRAELHRVRLLPDRHRERRRRAVPLGVAVSNTTGDAASVIVTKGAATIATAVVAPDSVQLLQLPWEPTLKGPGGGLLVPFPASVKVTQGAYRLRSTRPVTVYQFNPIEYAIGAGFSLSNDASILLPVNVWTGKYRVAARHHFSGVSGYYYVTAREDGTTVTTLPGPGGGFVKLGIPGLQANGRPPFTLNAGDVAAVVTAGGNAFNDPSDVTGTLVAADKLVPGHRRAQSLRPVQRPLL